MATMTAFVTALTSVAFLSTPIDTEMLFRKVATSALQGKYGKLPAWKKHAYKMALRGQIVEVGQAWVTSYHPQEGFYKGRTTRSGRGVSSRSAAISSKDWHKHKFRIVWTAAYGIRIIEDSGANYNDIVARKKGADRWIDYWFPRPHNKNPITAYVIIKER